MRLHVLEPETKALDTLSLPGATRVSIPVGSAGVQTINTATGPESGITIPATMADKPVLSPGPRRFSEGRQVPGLVDFDQPGDVRPKTGGIMAGIPKWVIFAGVGFLVWKFFLK